MPHYIEEIARDLLLQFTIQLRLLWTRIEPPEKWENVSNSLLVHTKEALR